MNSALNKWTEVSDGVFVPCLKSETGVVAIGAIEIAELKRAAIVSSKKRARLCAHTADSDMLHQMVLVIQKESYIHPHRHHQKVESFHLIEGEMDVVIFSDDGQILEKVAMCAYPNTVGSIFYRLNKDLYHTLIIHTPYVVFQEITQGPFDLAKTDYAPWAPAEADSATCKAWIENLKKDCQRA